MLLVEFITSLFTFHIDAIKLGEVFAIKSSSTLLGELVSKVAILSCCSERTMCSNSAVKCSDEKKNANYIKNHCSFPSQLHVELPTQMGLSTENFSLACSMASPRVSA